MGVIYIAVGYRLSGILDGSFQIAFLIIKEVVKEVGLQDFFTCVIAKSAFFKNML
jgi:hypothetical protein